MNLSFILLIVFAVVVCPVLPAGAADPIFQAGASLIDVSPEKLPAIRNGGFLQVIWTRNSDPLYARSLVLEDGSTSIVLCVVDSCMLPTDVCDA
ncbi:MAG TPA: hypothetical protein PK648_12255, partial [Verrucomicrobiales bacterium]|nr:hypothetical protein [Verrucomicrobiales bacterium]